MYENSTDYEIKIYFPNFYEYISEQQSKKIETYLSNFQEQPKQPDTYSLTWTTSRMALN